MFKPRQMVRLAREVRGIEPPKPDRRTQPRSLDQKGIDNLFAEATGVLPQTLIDAASEAGIAEDPTLDTYDSLSAAAWNVFETADQSKPNSDLLIQAITGVIRSFPDDDSLLTESVRQRNEEQSWVVRTANVAALSVRLAIELKFNERQSLALGMCALVHDIGMLTVPEEILEKPDLTDDEFQLLRNHPFESQRMVNQFGGQFSWMGKVAVQVHERQDGSGYPVGLKGDEIHETAQIIGLSDTYEAMTHPRADRKARVTYNALSEIIDVRNSLFNPDHIRALIRIVSIFPLGSLVKLNNGCIGRVVGVNRLYPTRPLMEILIDARGVKMEPPKILDLGEEPMIYIVDPAIEESVLD